MSSPAGWASCLDSFADHLAFQRQAIEDGSPELVTPFVPSAGLGPLPPALLPRARELSARADELTEAIEAARSRTLAALQQLRQPTESARPAYVDSMA